MRLENNLIFEAYLIQLIEAQRKLYYQIISDDPQIHRIVSFLEDAEKTPEDQLTPEDKLKIVFQRRELKRRLDMMDVDWWGIPRIDDVLRPRKRSPYIPSTVK